MAKLKVTQDEPGGKVTLEGEGFAPSTVTTTVKKDGAFSPEPWVDKTTTGSFERDVKLEPGLWEFEATDPDGTWTYASLDVA